MNLVLSLLTLATAANGLLAGANLAGWHGSSAGSASVEEPPHGEDDPLSPVDSEKKRVCRLTPSWRTISEEGETR